LVVPVLVAEKVGVTPETGLLVASLSVIVTVEDAAPLAITGPEPVMVEFTATADPAVKITVPSVLATGVTIERVLVSAVAELKVQVETPEAFETEQVP
jgi:propanediol dehydratase small subunit